MPRSRDQTISGAKKLATMIRSHTTASTLGTRPHIAMAR